MRFLETPENTFFWKLARWMRGILELKSEGLCCARSVQSSLNRTEIKDGASAVCSRNVILSWGEFTSVGRNGAIWLLLGNVCIWWSRKTRPDLLTASQSTETHLAASPPGRRFDTLGLPSLSDPPEMVRPRLLPSRFIRSTVVTPRCSSADRWGHRHGFTVSVCLRLADSAPPRANKRLTFLFFWPESLTKMFPDTCSFKSFGASESLWQVQKGGWWSLFHSSHAK